MELGRASNGKSSLTSFYDAFWSGDVGTAQAMSDTGAVEVASVNATVAMWECVHGGNLAVAQWLVTKQPAQVDLHFREDVFFRQVCCMGEAPFAKWLWSLGGVKLHARDDDAIRGACFMKHLELARWLISLDPDWAWPQSCLRALQTWSPCRDAWITACVVRPRVKK